MKTSKLGIQVIQHYEGCKLKQYLCQAGVPTIGTGHTKGVKIGDVITQTQADEFLSVDLKDAEAAVNAEKLDINQAQFDALASFTFQEGAGALHSSTLVKRIRNKESDTAIEIEFSKWNKVKVDGKLVVSAGVTARRKSEFLLFSTGVVKFFN